MWARWTLRPICSIGSACLISEACEWLPLISQKPYVVCVTRVKGPAAQVLRGPRGRRRRRGRGGADASERRRGVAPRKVELAVVRGPGTGRSRRPAPGVPGAGRSLG
ncbi:hypothetical protein GCM10010301_05770 [Streptomyces plicatus]|nr:hypothetical protein GCM10010301_05770 [Streptomyces plicatus]